MGNETNGGQSYKVQQHSYFNRTSQIKALPTKLIYKRGDYGKSHSKLRYRFNYRMNINYIYQIAIPQLEGLLAKQKFSVVVWLSFLNLLNNIETLRLHDNNLQLSRVRLSYGRNSLFSLIIQLEIKLFPDLFLSS